MGGNGKTLVDVGNSPPLLIENPNGTSKSWGRLLISSSVYLDTPVLKMTDEMSIATCINLSHSHLTYELVVIYHIFYQVVGVIAQILLIDLAFGIV